MSVGQNLPIDGMCAMCDCTTLILLPPYDVRRLSPSMYSEHFDPMQTEHSNPISQIPFSSNLYGSRLHICDATVPTVSVRGGIQPNGRENKHPSKI